MRVLLIAAITMVASAAPRNGRATMPELPPLNEQSVRLRGEAVVADEPKVMLLNLATEGPRVLIFATGREPYATSTVFDVQTVSVKNGRVTVEGLGRDEQSLSVKIVGKGISFEQQGIMSAQVTVLGPKKKKLTSWKVAFHAHGGTVVRDLCKLAATAEALVQKR